MITFTIPYEPTPKGVPRTRYVNGHTLTYYHWNTIKALEDIRYIIASLNLEPFPPHVPLKLDITFYRHKSKWLKGTAKRETMPVRKPDLDNFCKLAIDAISHIIIPDDAQITQLIARKRWSENGQGRIEVKISDDI